MNKGVIVQSILAGLVDSSGNPLASGKVYSYEVGTTTPKSLFSDKDCATPLTNPFTLGANGTYQCYAYGSYKFVIETAAGVTVATHDNLFFNPVFSSYVPSITADSPMTLSGTSVLAAKFVRHGDLVNFLVSFSTTVGGTPTGIIKVSLPITAVNQPLTAAVQVTDGGVIGVGTCDLLSTTVLNIRKSSGNYTAGVVGPTIYGFFQAA